MARAGVRAGFSLIELTISLLLLDVGVLALAATAGGIVRMTAAGGREGSAALVAAARLEELRVSACGPAAPPGSASGADSTGPFLARWTLGPAAPAREAQVVVSWADGRGTRTATFATRVACAP